MDIRDVKIKEEDWQKFSPYISGDDFDIELGVSIILFDLNKEETTFTDILKTIESYHTELVEIEEIYDVCIWCELLSSVDPIFFQEYAKEHIGTELVDYQEQANCGAIYYCEEFIRELYKKMKKDGLFDK